MMRIRSLCIFAAALSLGTTALADVPDTIASADASLGDPIAIAAGEDGETIVVTDEWVARLDAFGDPIDRAAIEGVVDLAADPSTARIAVLHADGVTVLEPTLAIAWQRALRVDEGGIAVGERGTVAIVANGRVRAFDANGSERFASPTDVEADAIAVLDDAGLVVVGGARRGRAALVAFDAHGEVHWDAWRDVDDASAHVVDVRRGGDGALYMLAVADGDARLGDEARQPADRSRRVAMFARMTPSGTLARAGWVEIDAPFSTVRPDAIDADGDGNVYLIGSASHELVDAGWIEAAGGAIGFYRVITPDLAEVRVSREFAVDDLEGEPARLDVQDDRALAIIPATAHDEARIVALPTEPDQHEVERQPDRDDVGTFGYESGVSGADPTCYCDARRSTPPSWWAATIVLVALTRPRRRRV